MIADGYWAERTRWIVDDIHKQLLIRPAFPQAWGDDPQRAELALWLCKRIAETIDWPSECYIPDDPMNVLLWEHIYGAGDVVELMLWIDEKLNIRLSYDDVESWMGHTLGEVVDLLLAGRIAFL